MKHHTGNFESWAPSYDRSILQRLMFEPTHDAALHAFSKAAPAPHDVLDAGCGTGRLLEAASRRWPEARLVGIDAAQAMIAQAERKHSGESRYTFLKGDASSLPLESCSFDAAFSTMSFHHWTDQAGGIREMARVLRPGGCFVLADIHVPFLRFLRPFLRWGDHPNLQGPDAIRQLLQDAGFSIVEDRRFRRLVRVQLCCSSFALTRLLIDSEGMALNATSARQAAQRARQRLRDGFLSLQELAVSEHDEVRSERLLTISEHAARIMSDLYVAESDSVTDAKLEAFLLKIMLGMRALLSELQDPLVSDGRLDIAAEAVAMAVATLYAQSRTHRPGISAPPSDPRDAGIPLVRKSRRLSARVHVEADVGFATETNFYAGLSMDISLGGLFVATYKVHPIGTQVALFFELPGGRKVSLYGEVRWVRETRVGDSAPGIGVAFTQVSHEDLGAIRAFCSQRDPMVFEQGE